MLVDYLRPVVPRPAYRILVLETAKKEKKGKVYLILLYVKCTKSYLSLLKLNYA